MSRTMLVLMAMVFFCGDSVRGAPLPQKFRETHIVVFETSMGTFTVRLFPKKAPKTVANFLRYADKEFYSNTIFHRVIPDFMIQGGGFDGNFAQKPTQNPVVNEADNGLSNKRGTLAVARTQDPDSGTSQFFINVKDNAYLDHKPDNVGQRAGYCVFGEVIEGMEVVDRISKAQRGKRGAYSDVPTENIVIRSVHRLSR